MNLFKPVLFFIILIYFPKAVFSQQLITAEIDTGGHRVANLGELVVLSSEDSQFENLHKQLSYVWSIISKPSDSKTQLFSVNNHKTSFRPDTKGTYTIRLFIYSQTFVEHKDTIISVNSPVIRPVAKAGEDETLRPGSVISLDGSGSFHFGSEEDLEYEWVLESMPQGSSAQIYFPSNKQTSFIADVEGVYLARLIVRSGDTQSLPAYKMLRIEGVSLNLPQAMAGQDQVVLINENLNLTGTVTYTGSESLSYLWDIVSAPENSQIVLTNPESLNPTFETDTSGTYILSFQASAGDLISSPDFIEIKAGQKPIALALSTNLIGLINQKLNLNAGSSYDPEALNLEYSWTVLQKPVGSLVQISDNLQALAEFSGNKEGDYLLELRVKNDLFASDPKQVRVRLISPNSFQAEAGNNQVITAGSLLSLSASSSVGSNLSYLWTLIDKPDLSQSDLLNNRLLNPTISIDRKGAYIFKLAVIKEGFLSKPDYILFNSVLPQGTNFFNEDFMPQAKSLTLPISECEEIKRQIPITDTSKEYLIWFENEGVEEYFVLLNGKALTGSLNSSSDVSVYAVSLEEMNSLSVRMRGLQTNKLKIRILEKSAVQNLPTPPALTDQSLTVTSGSSGTVAVGGSGLTYSVVEEPEYGSVVINNTGQVTYSSSNETTNKKDLVVIKGVNSVGLAGIAVIDVTIN